MISRDDKNGWKRVSVLTTQIFQDFQKGGRGDSKERQEGGVGHQGRRDGEVGTTKFTLCKKMLKLEKRTKLILKTLC